MNSLYKKNTTRTSHHNTPWRAPLLFIIYHLSFIISISVSLTSCAIKDDIPYPIVESGITAFEVQGQCDQNDQGFAAATINKKDAIVEVLVSDTVSLKKLRILKMNVSNEASIIPGEGVCLRPDLFPLKSFDRPADTDNTLIDLSTGSAAFTLRTYQDYEWKVQVKQVILREVEVAGQVGEAVIDPENCNIVVYVNSQQDLSKITVTKFKPAGQHCTVSPDPVGAGPLDFMQKRTFQITPGNSTQSQLWQMFIYPTNDEQQQTTTAEAFVRNSSATVSGSCPTGSTPIVEYRRVGDDEWTQVPQSQVVVSGSKYTAEVTGLTPGGTYEFHTRIGDEVTPTSTPSYTTSAPEQLENGGFDDWHIEGSGTRALYLPWAEGAKPYWGTGNAGATTVGPSNSTYVDEGGRRFANLESRYIVIKFAAGNIFTGEYIETDGTNGVLSFGRPFTSFPTKMRFDYKYRTSTINRTGGEWKEAYGNYITRKLYDGLKGQPDSCNVFIALGDWEPVMYKDVECPYLIRTRPSALHLFDTNDPHLIAYGQMTQGRDVSTWTTETININYRVRDRRPKYIIVVASSSKYGDYFTGGEESLMQIDNIELLYD